MTQLLAGLTDLVAFGFGILALVATREWIRTRGRGPMYQALAVGLLALVSIGGRVQALAPSRIVADLNVVAFMACGYALLLFRGVFVPLSSRTKVIASTACVLASLAAVVFPLPASTDTPTPFQSGLTLVIIGIWVLCVGEPIFRFWQASRSRPTVQRARLRALSLGYAGIVGILIVAGTLGRRLQNPVSSVIIEVVALLTIPFLWAAFSPPRWMRYLWRAEEEDALRRGIQDLVLFADSSFERAERAVDWALRLFGGESGFIADSTGTILAAKNIDESTVARVRALVAAAESGTVINVDATTTAIAVPIRAADVDCEFVVLSGPFTPVFGSDEVGRLNGYATSVALGIARARMTERLAGAERAKSAFLNLASHELRGPLTVIRGYITMIAEGDFGSFPALESAVLPALVRQAEHMSLLIEQMIETARLEDERLELHCEPWSFAELARSVVQEVASIAPPEATFTVTGEIVKSVINADRERVRTIVMNLIDNAVKYSPQGAVVTCTLEGDDAVVTLTVEDRGVGIPEAEFPRLFTRFGRIVTRDNAHISGTGLGLYLCRELARRHGGDVTASPRPGGGMRFVLTMPLEQITPGPAIGDAVVEAGSGDRRAD